MDGDELQRALEEAGLTTYQADAYITLLERGMTPAVEVANNCSVPVSRIYDVLRDLETMEYVETFEQDTLHARPHDPAHVLQDLRESGQLLTNAAEEIEERWESPEITDHKMSVVKHADTVIERAREQITNAEVSVELAVTIDQLDRLAPALADARERGVIVNAAVYAVDDPETIVDGLETSLSELRACYIPGPFLAIIDRTNCYFGPNSRASESYGILIDDYILSFVFHWYFRSCLWTPWETIHSDEKRLLNYVDLRTFVRDIAELWSDGATIGVTIYGTDIPAGEERTLGGELVDIIYPGVETTSSTPSSEQLAGQVTLVLDTGEDRYSIGGWGAIFEDFEAKRIRLDTIEFERDSCPLSGTPTSGKTDRTRT